jgi:hypothetical protein
LLAHTSRRRCHSGDVKRLLDIYLTGIPPYRELSIRLSD